MAKIHVANTCNLFFYPKISADLQNSSAPCTECSQKATIAKECFDPRFTQHQSHRTTVQIATEIFIFHFHERDW